VFTIAHFAPNQLGPNMPNTHSGTTLGSADKPHSSFTTNDCFSLLICFFFLFGPPISNVYGPTEKSAFRSWTKTSMPVKTMLVKKMFLEWIRNLASDRHKHNELLRPTLTLSHESAPVWSEFRASAGGQPNPPHLRTVPVP